MWQAILENLMTIGWVFCLFCMCVIAHILAKTNYNVKKLEQQFSLPRLLDGIVHMLCIGLATSLLAVVASCIPYVPVLANMFTSQEMQEVVSFVIIISCYAKGIVKYFTKALKAIDKAMNGDETQTVIIQKPDEDNGQQKLY